MILLITRLVKPVLLRATNLIPMLIPDFPFFVVPSGTYSVAFQYYELKDVPKAVHKPNFDMYLRLSEIYFHRVAM